MSFCQINFYYIPLNRQCHADSKFYKSKDLQNGNEICHQRKFRNKQNTMISFLHIKYLIFSNTIDDELTVIVYHMVFLLVA